MGLKHKDTGEKKKAAPSLLCTQVDILKKVKHLKSWSKQVAEGISSLILGQIKLRQQSWQDI